LAIEPCRWPHRSRCPFPENANDEPDPPCCGSGSSLAY
jgi:hypothetical protein